MDFGLDPVQRERHQPHAAARVEAAHRLHQADVAFLDQVRLRQAVAQVLPADGDDQAQVRHHELACCFEIVVPLQPRAEILLLLGSEQRKPVHRLDVVVETPQRRRNREIQCHRLIRHGSRLLDALLPCQF